MKTIVILLLFAISTCFGQNTEDKTIQKLVYKWELQDFQEAEWDGRIVTVTKTKYAENVSFDFKSDGTLEVIYSESKKENYFWKIKRDLLEITYAQSDKYNSNITGWFEIIKQKKSELFLQRINKPHHGIMLKKLTL